MRRQLPPRGSPIPWPTTHLTVTALGIGLLVGIDRLFPGLRRVSEFAPAGLVVALFTVTSLLYRYDYRNGFRERR